MYPTLPLTNHSKKNITLKIIKFSLKNFNYFIINLFVRYVIINQLKWKGKCNIYDVCPQPLTRRVEGVGWVEQGNKCVHMTITPHTIYISPALYTT